MEESKRTLVGNIGLALALTVSGVYQPWLLKLVGDWKITITVTLMLDTAIMVMPMKVMVTPMVHLKENRAPRRGR